MITMITTDERICPKCGGQLKYYDSVKRIVRTKNRTTKRIILRRMRCTKCGKLHREIPKFIIPYKEYEYEVIMGVLEGYVTSDTLGYEDYPCEMTMIRWKKEYANQI